MPSAAYPFPVAVSQFSDPDSREAQNVRAVDWLLQQSGGPIVVVTPRRKIESESLNQLIGRPDTVHLTWRGFSTASLTNRRVICAWPDRQHLDDLGEARADAVVVIEWGADEAQKWAEDAQAVRLLPGQIVRPTLPGQIVRPTSDPDDPRVTPLEPQ
jgi:hypothetical protein